MTDYKINPRKIRKFFKAAHCLALAMHTSLGDAIRFLLANPEVRKAISK